MDVKKEQNRTGEGVEDEGSISQNQRLFRKTTPSQIVHEISSKIDTS